MKKTLIALSITSLLTACGGSSSEESGLNSSSTEYRVIDGYLNKADVCLIAEGETNCGEIYQTDENGLITLPAGTESGQLVATIVAGQTSDADSVGYVGKTYQMIANISDTSQNVITPYTTLDALDSTKSIEDIAADLGLSVDLIKGDYVASNHEDKVKVHAIARALATQLAEKKDDNDSAKLSTLATEINEYITTELENNDTDLSKQNIVIDENGAISYEKAITSLSDFLESAELTVQSLNSYRANHEDKGTATFSNGQFTLTNDENPSSYEIIGNKLTLLSDGETEAETDQYLYVSNKLSLSVPLENTKDLILTSTSAAINTTAWTKTELTGNTFYFISDDAGTDISTPKPLIMEMKFNEDSVIISDITDINEETGDGETVSWNIAEGKLTINTLDVTERDLIFSKEISDNNVTMLSDSAKEGVALTAMFKEKSFATSIYESWVKLTN